MWSPSAEQEKISDLLREAIRVLIGNGVDHNKGFAVEGRLQVITDTKQTFEIDVNELMGLTNEDLITLKQELNISEQASISSTNFLKGGKYFFIMMRTQFK